MGAWGYKFYENDEAADWFSAFWESKDFQLIENLVTNFEIEDEEQCSLLRAAAHILIAFDNPYTTPSGFWDSRAEIVSKTISFLEQMIDTSREDNYFLELWDAAPEVITDIQNQITQLKANNLDARE